jgi:hypothetical protein
MYPYPTALRKCPDCSGSMLVANVLCWFCRDTAHMALADKKTEH